MYLYRKGTGSVLSINKLATLLDKCSLFLVTTDFLTWTSMHSHFGEGKARPQIRIAMCNPYYVLKLLML